MECKQIKDDLLLYAAGALDEAEAEGVRRHLAGGCPRCAGQLAEAEATLAMLSLTLAQSAAPAGARERLLERVSENRESGPAPVIAGGLARPSAPPPPPPSLPPPPPPPWWAMLAIPSAIAAAVAAGVTIFFAMRLEQRQPAAMDNTALTMLSAMVAQEQEQISALKSQQAQSAQSEARAAAWASDPDLRMLTLSGTENQPATAHGRVFWEPDRGVWHFFAMGMKSPPAGKTYELWFVSRDQKMALPAGAFNPDPGGEAELQTNVPAAIAPALAIAAVTDEPAHGEITAPTGSFQLKGSLP